MTIETRIEQISTVILQLDDSKVPRNIRAGAKEAVEKWLLNKSKRVRFVKLPSSAGMGPESWLSDIVKSLRFCLPVSFNKLNIFMV